LVTEQTGFRNGISTEDAAFRQTDSVLRSINKQSMLGEFSEIWRSLLIVWIMKLC